jgi:hypothetical protein
MRLLIVVPGLETIKPFLEHYKVEAGADEALPYLFHARVLHHDVDILESGYGVFQLTYKLTKVLAQGKYHLALKLAAGAAYKEQHAIGGVLNIINEKPGDYGSFEGREWKDLYEHKLLNADEVPHVRGSFVNMTNAYLNIFLPFKKVLGISVSHFSDTGSYAIRREKYKADCETTDGVGFSYVCLYEKQLFYHLCIVEKNLETGAQNSSLAAQNLNEVLVDLLQKL